MISSSFTQIYHGWRHSIVQYDAISFPSMYNIVFYPGVSFRSELEIARVGQFRLVTLYPIDRSDK